MLGIFPFFCLQFSGSKFNDKKCDFFRFIRILFVSL